MASFAIKEVDVFDGTAMLRGQTVTVDAGTIVAVGRNIDAPSDLRVIEGSGCTLLPGLIDSHVHFEGEASLKQSLIFGVTTVFDMFCDYRDAAEMKRYSTDEGRPIADIITAGTLATSPNGHGTEYGLPIPTISTPEEAVAFVDARISEGSDYIKIVYDDGSAYGRPFPTLDKATLSALIRAAHERGKLAVVHALSIRFAMDALECGADGLVHLFLDAPATADFLDLLTKSRAFVIPTLAVFENVCGIQGGASLLSESDFESYLPEAAVKSLRAPFRKPVGVSPSYQVPRATIRLLKEKGVPILAGTDAPNPGTTFGATLHRELELLVDAGMSPGEALASATSIPAETFGLHDRGQITRGRRADMLMVAGDPTSNIEATMDIVAVWRLGRRVERRPDRVGFR